jgi:hypothetical protein
MPPPAYGADEAHILRPGKPFAGWKAAPQFEPTEGEQAKLATETAVSEAPAELAAARASEEWAGQEVSVGLPVSALEQAVPARWAAVEASEKALRLAEREALEMELAVLQSEVQAASPEAVQRERQQELGPARPVVAVVRLRPAALAAVATK